MAKILVVDNASFMRSSLKYILETAGHTVVGMAENGKEALSRYKELKPDLVTMDILMEEMGGLEALEAIRKEDPEARVIMLTALGQESTIEKAMLLGASGYIRKPFKPADIVVEVARVMSLKQHSAISSQQSALE